MIEIARQEIAEIPCIVLRDTRLRTAPVVVHYHGWTASKFLSGNPGFGGTSKEETLWGMYRACGDQGSGRDKRGFDTPGMHFHSQVAA